MSRPDRPPSSAWCLPRRDLLRAAGALPLLGLLRPFAALALGDATRLDIAEIRLPSGTVERNRGWVRLLYEVTQTTSVETLPRTVVLDPDDPVLFDHPFAVLTGSDALPDLSEKAREQLVRYLQYGGFLFVDDVSGVKDSAFDASFRRLADRLFPTRPLTVLPSDHSLYRAFFLIRQPLGRLDLLPYLEGVSLGETTPLVYCRNDLSGALERGEDGRDRYTVSPGGEWQRREAVKLGINLVMYALTSNYKKDAAHVRKLMLDGRLE